MNRVLFVFDTTASMNHYIVNARQGISYLATEFISNPEISVGFIAHGDYYDRDRMIQDSTHTYTYTGQLPIFDPLPNLTYFTDVSQMKSWLSVDRSTDGGDWEECIEYLLRYLQIHALSAKKVGDTLTIIYVGDAAPHDSYANPYGLDWHTELKNLITSYRKMSLYTVQCGSNETSFKCLTEIAKQGYGMCVKLKDIQNLITAMIAIVKKDTGGFDEYAEKLRAEGIDENMEEILVDLGASCF